MAVPMVLLFSGRIRSSATSLYVCALMVIFGFLANRLNVGLTGMEAASGVTYIPKWTEVAVTLGIVALGFALFTFIARRVPVFEEEEPNVIEMLERTKEGRAEVVAAR
jgi:Ni/Fe-hydrogenase subunit HybB-like protein